ncbi:Fpg/Nei family DNA glycosylase [Ruania suaedae]|uniref:Fpg/Nei family DNA glycosylase n=1 Tax=Ruania suaedae TaxID=2897774 RepID=UPI001E311DEB|nr:DNA-formamidopyrimidine glycosylase family protein [Ruania suaedae]UFU04169.1 Fpg/Nei family DNA glycosylase [Ruania suaedae]
MPEMPEVAALAAFLTERLVGRTVAAVHVPGIQALKTFDPPPQALVGRAVDRVDRHGKWLEVRTGADPDGDQAGLSLVVHLARAGWLRWQERAPATVPRSPKSPIAVRVVLDDGSAFDLTEAGTRKRLAVHVVREAAQIPMVASLGPDPLGEAFTPAVLSELLGRRRAQLKGVLRDQSIVAGIGNAYSDEILHAARLSPFAPSTSLPAEEIGHLHATIRTVLAEALAAAAGTPAAQLKDAKRAGMRVHGRAGQPCPVCGDVVREVSFADSSLQYCASCQTGGKILADRRMSRLLR